MIQKRLLVLLFIAGVAVILLPIRLAHGQVATTTPASPAHTETVGTAGATATPQPPAVITTSATVTPVRTTNTGVPGSLLAQNLTLSSLGVQNAELVSPQGSVQFPFHVPDNWQFEGASSLNLNVQVALSGASDSPITSVLSVQLDGVLVNSVTIAPGTTGPQTVTIGLGTATLNNPLHRAHTIQISLDARDQCLANQELRVLIRSDQSYFHFEYQELLPTHDLAGYPRPFFNDNFSTQIVPVLLVLPAKYTTGDLEAAASVSAGFGLLTNNSVQVRMTTTDAISDQDQRNNNLVLIGHIGSHALLDSLYSSNALPTQLNPKGGLAVKDQPIADTDGVIQLIANPKNPMHSILAVTGETPEGVQKAARALGGPVPSLGVGGPLALISDVHTPAAAPNVDTFTFASLGYQDVTINGIGTRTAQIKFVAPSGTILANDAYVDLEFDYAATLQTAQTTLTLAMNGRPLDSITLGSVTTNNKPAATQPVGVHQLRAAIPPQSVRLGESNTLTIALDVQGNWKCYPPSATAIWLSARSTSVLYLPRQNVDAQFLPQQVSNFPSPFISTRDLRDTWIALPDKPTMTELDEAYRLIALLGSETPNGTDFQPHVSLGKPSADVDVSNYDFIVYGRPSTNTFLGQINDKLPQPFAVNSDNLKQVLDSVSYRLPPAYSIGVVQSLKSPWSPNRSILAITGTDPEGQSNAMNVLIGGSYGRSDLEGDVIYAAANTISTVNTTNPNEGITLTTDIPNLVTLSAQIGPATPTLYSAQTVTPGPTMTYTPSRTPQSNVTATPVSDATVVASPIALPTFAPLSQADITPEQAKQPIWVTGLAIVTGVVIAIVLLLGLINLIRTRRKS
ncbi:MAG: cellulose biosynthesis cyclic di-GMP-binding regulatory protein BcsB [Aggregatilineales bacterium]